MPRRRRTLTDEERALWSEVARTATPIEPALPKPDPMPKPNAQEPSPPPGGPFPRGATLKPFGRPEAPFATTLAEKPGVERLQMDRKAFERMARGRMQPQSRLDLHGMTVAHAHDRLRGFVLRAHSEGLRLVLVITGKGKRGGDDAIIPERHGVLRHQVPHWLRLPPLGPLILQVAPAHRRHGGDGAYYVYLRRNRE